MQLQQLPAVCISLDRRPDRWNTFKEHADAAGLQIQRFSAVDAKSFEAHKHPAVSLGTAHNIYYGVRRSHYEIDAAGAIGCSLSHFGVWKQFLQTNAPAILVFEDDAAIPRDFVYRFQTVAAALPADWDIIQFQRTIFDGGVPGSQPIQGESPWEIVTGLTGSYAYMISRRGAERMLAKAYPIELHIDAYMAYMCRMKHVRMLWHPALDMGVLGDDSDIAHGSQGILAIPTDMENYGLVVLDTKSIFGVVAMAAMFGGIVSLAYLSAVRPR